MTVGEEDAVLELLTWRLIIYYRIVKHCDRQRAQWTWLPLELRSEHLEAIHLPFFVCTLPSIMQYASPMGIPESPSVVADILVLPCC